ncbi:hypothetical protein D4T97_000870 [Siminovitchia acidinfaciens]|uniref:Uncharacterized protein n=1 Tax=Siminovitchia acidinfaciens TaxID=2321395 RepID=A0A429Y6S5_9BACI|nr:YwmB family TATA-box binding protein [Siminovitchia acidinfaciens]RST77083.1 hypothetical protein D4T97_000870 [Siminovitchia acidinfaciens]
MKGCCREYFILLLLLTSLIVFFSGNNTSVAEKSELDIEKLVHAVQKQQGSIIEWSLYTRELAEQPSQELSVTRLKRVFPEWDWSLSRKEGKETVTGINYNGKIEEKIVAVTTDNGNKDNLISYVSYELKGTTWNHRISKSTETLFQSRTELIFKQKPVVFSCIKGIFNDDEFGQTIVSGLLSSLLAKEKEALREEDFSSISAYSSLFTQSLSLPGKEMNLQIGLRKNKAGNGTYFTVGTPILTNEY